MDWGYSIFYAYYLKRFFARAVAATEEDIEKDYNIYG